MRVLITGGCGFIGSNLAEELSKRYDVVVLDDLSSGSLKNIDGLDVEFIKGSITNIDLLKEFFRDIDCVFHQAAVVSIQDSIENPIKVNEVNVEGTLNVLVAARDAGVKKIINASSCAVYGDASKLPLREEAKVNPKSPYAVTKLVGEYYCKIFSEIYGLRTVSLRYFNVYGPKQYYTSDYAAVIPKFITRIIRGKSPIIYGDGKQTRDFIFVKDVVLANVLALESKAEGVFNIATGKAISIEELASLIMDILGKDLEIKYDKPREGDIRHSIGDISKAKEILGFEPKYSIEKGLRETVKWFLEKKFSIYTSKNRKNKLSDLSEFL